MKKVFLFGAAVTLSLAAVLVSSCEKDQTPFLDSPADYNLVDIQLDLAFQEIDDAGVASGMIRRGAYPQITVDSTSGVIKRMAIDWGTTPYLCPDGNYRSGKIVIAWTGKYQEVGTTYTGELREFVQNGLKYGPTNFIVRNDGINADGFQKWGVTSSGKCYLEGGDSISWSGTRDRVWIEGSKTPNDRSDDKFEISGTNNFTNRKGKNFNTIITDKVIADFSCPWRITKGKVEIVPTLRPDWTMRLDYGDGSCQSTGTFTLGKKTHTFTKQK